MGFFDWWEKGLTKEASDLLKKFNFDPGTLEEDQIPLFEDIFGPEGKPHSRRNSANK